MGPAILAVILLAVFAVKLVLMFLGRLAGDMTKDAKSPEEAFGKVVMGFGALLIIFLAFQQHSFLSGLAYYLLSGIALGGFVAFVAPSAMESDDDKKDGKDEDIIDGREDGLFIMLFGLVTLSFFDSNVISFYIAEPWLIFHDSNELMFEAGWVNYFIFLGSFMFLLFARKGFSAIFKKGAAIIYYASLMGFSWWFFGFQQVFAG
jgi:hypothetical protein